MSRPPELPSVRVERDLRRRIDAGEWDHGQALPTVARLAQDYRVGKGTINKVLRTLAEGAPEAQRTIQAKAALARLEKP